MRKILHNNLSEMIRDAKTFLILTHKRPDGDAISSSLAMFWYLLDKGKKETSIDVIIPEYSDEFSFINGIEHLKAEPTREKYDLAILVDCAELRMLKGGKYLKLASKTVCIDHHEKTFSYAHYNVVDTEAASCTSIIFEILPCTRKNYLTCIATGLISDTSNLTLNVTPKARNIIERLEQLGVDVNGISRKLSTKSSRTEELAELVIERGKFIEDKIFCTYLLQEDLLDNEKNLTNVNHKLIIQEIQKKVDFETLIFLIENDLGEFKASLRTFSKIDLNQICTDLVNAGKALKGGGHSYSAGCTITGSYYDVFKVISEEILKYK